MKVLHVPAFKDTFGVLWFACPVCCGSHLAGREYGRVRNPCRHRHASPTVDLELPELYFLED